MTESNPDKVSLAQAGNDVNQAVQTSETKALVKWTIAMAIASWALVAVTTYAAYVQRLDAKKLLHAQVSMELDKEFDSAEMRHSREQLALQVQNKEKITETRPLDFLDKVGLYNDEDLIDDDTTYSEFSYYIERYWVVFRDYVKDFRQKEHDNEYYLNFEGVYNKIASEDAAEHDSSPAAMEPSQDQISEFLSDEATLTK